MFTLARRQVDSENSSTPVPVARAVATQPPFAYANNYSLGLLESLNQSNGVRLSLIEKVIV
jgi:hypothetical protein